MRKLSVQTPIASGETAADRVASFRSRNRTFFWEPYPWQRRLLEATRNKSTIAAISSNKIGKCLTYQSLIDTPDGPVAVGTLFHRGKPFDVFAWDGRKKVLAKAHPPFKKDGLHECYRITMSDGRMVEAADHHKILCRDGEYFSTQDVLSTFFGNHPVSTSGTSQSVHGEGDRNFFETQSSFPGHYFEDSRPGGGLLQTEEATARASFPLSNGFQAHIPYCYGLGGRVEKYRHILLSLRNALLCKQRQFVGQTVEFLGQIFGTSCLSLTNGLQGFQLPYEAVNLELRPNSSAFLRSPDTVPSYSPPLCIDGNEVISSDYIGCQEVYDFTVPKYHNYCAAGLVHHNTAAVVNILISWLLGYEPWQYVAKDDPEAVEQYGIYYRRSSLGIKPPVNLILTGEDWKLHIGRVLVPELKKWAPAGWYETKKNEQGTEYYWEWNNKSTLTIMSYSQDDDLFESFRAQGVVMDEPPPQTKYAAMSRGLLLDCGKTLMSLTPLKEAWILDEIVLSGRRDIGIVDGLNITDNPDLYNSDLATLGEMGLSDVQKQKFFDLLLYEDKAKLKFVSDRGHAAEKYLEEIIYGQTK